MKKIETRSAQRRILTAFSGSYCQQVLTSEHFVLSGTFGKEGDPLFVPVQVKIRPVPLVQ